MATVHQNGRHEEVGGFAKMSAYTFPFLCAFSSFGWEAFVGAWSSLVSDAGRSLVSDSVSFPGCVLTVAFRLSFCVLFLYR